MLRQDCIFEDNSGQRHVFGLYPWSEPEFWTMPPGGGVYLLASQCPRTGDFTTLRIGHAGNLRARMRDHACVGSDLRLRLKIARPGAAPAITHVFVADGPQAEIAAFYEKRLGPARSALDPQARGYERVLRFLFPALCEEPPAHRRLLEEMRRLYGAAQVFRIVSDGSMVMGGLAGAARAA